MTQRIAIIAALPGELKPLVHSWTATTNERSSIYRTRIDDIDCIAIAGGIGREPAARGCMLAIEEGKPSAFLSIGWAGALSCGMKPGNAFTVNEVIDASTGERYRTDAPAGDPSDIRLVTTKRIAGKTEKKQLCENYSATLVDMEAATVGRMARMHNIPFYCLKAVSDEANERLPDMNPFITRSGQMQTARFVASVLVRPNYWPALIRMGKNSNSSSIVLAGAVRNLISELTHASHHQTA